MKTRKLVLIIGAGFAGLNAAKKLGTNPNLDITIIDRNNHHLFQPLLYQVAMAGLSPAEIAMPIRSILARYHMQVLMGEVKTIDLKNKKAGTDFGELPFDYLVVAAGAEHSYFGHEDWENFAPGLKTVTQATEIRRRVLTAFEEAEREKNTDKQKELLTFVVVGGGPTGVELAGALGEISRYTLSKDFHNIDPRLARVILIEAGPRILPSFSEISAHQAMRDLENLGVQVWTTSRVTKIHGTGIEIGSEVIRARTVLWAAGVKPSPLAQFFPDSLMKDGRVRVEKDLSIAGYPNVFVAGDLAYLERESGKPLPGLAPVAMQEGLHVAKTIERDLAGQTREAFRYVDKGQMATIGRKKAVVELKHLRFSGLIAWITWLVVHIFYLIGFRNRLFVLLNWTWSYFRFRRGARLIVAKEWRSFLTALLLSLLVGCSHAPVAKREESMRPAPVQFSLQTANERQALLALVEMDLRILSTPWAPEYMSFGTTIVRKFEYRQALDYLVQALRSEVSEAAISEILQSEFTTYEVSGDQDWGRISIEPMLLPTVVGALRTSAEFSEPLYKIPKDLVRVQLADYGEKFETLKALAQTAEAGNAKSRYLMGRYIASKDKLESLGAIEPYYTEAEIRENRILAKQGLELVWLRPEDAQKAQNAGVIRVEVEGHKDKFFVAAANNGREFNFFREAEAPLGTRINGFYLGGRSLIMDPRFYPMGALGLFFPEMNTREVHFVTTAEAKNLGFGKVKLYTEREAVAGGMAKLYFLVPQPTLLEKLRRQSLEGKSGLHL